MNDSDLDILYEYLKNPYDLGNFVPSILEKAILSDQFDRQVFGGEPLDFKIQNPDSTQTLCNIENMITTIKQFLQKKGQEKVKDKNDFENYFKSL